MFWPARSSSARAAPVTPATASHRGPESRSRIDVRMSRSAWSASTRDSSSERRYSLTHRSSPPKATSPTGLPASMASAARYTPTGQPSVRCTRSSIQLAGASTPAPTSRASCFGRGHGQLPRAELQDVALGTQPARLDRQALARGQRQLPARGNSHRELGQRGMAAVVRDVLEVVEHDGHGCADRLDRGDEGGDDRDAAAARRQQPQGRWAEVRDRADRCSDGGPECDGVVVGLVARHPRHSGPQPLGPLRQDGGLPVTGRRHEGDDGCVRAEQPLDQCVSADDASTRGRGVELRPEACRRQRGAQRLPARTLWLLLNPSGHGYGHYSRADPDLTRRRCADGAESAQALHVEAENSTTSPSAIT